MEGLTLALEKIIRQMPRPLSAQNSSALRDCFSQPIDTYDYRSHLKLDFTQRPLLAADVQFIKTALIQGKKNQSHLTFQVQYRDARLLCYSFIVE